MTRQVNNCQLEIDEERGVVYVHNEGRTLVRICQIPKNVITNQEWIDVVFDRELAKEL